MQNAMNVPEKNERFFQIAHPFFDDFFMFRNEERGVFDDPFFDRAPRLFSANPSRISSPAPTTKRLSSPADPYHGVVRNIPIRVEQSGAFIVSSATTEGEHNILQAPSPAAFDEPRRSYQATERQLSPPPPPVRKYYNHVAAPTHHVPPTTSSSDEDADPVTPRFPVASHSYLEAPARTDARPSPTDLHTMDKLVNRLQQLAAKTAPRNVFEGTDFPSERRSQNSYVSSGESSSGRASSDRKRISEISTSSDAPSESSVIIYGSGGEQEPLPPIPRAHLSPSPQPKRIAKSPVPDSIFYEVKPTSTSVLETVFDNLDHESPRSSWSHERDLKVPTTVDGMPREAMPAEKSVRHDDLEVLERKRAVVTELSDALRMIDGAVQMVQRSTAPRFWRAPHVLQMHLGTLQDGCHLLSEQLDAFVEATARISIDSRHQKADELRRLITPLRDTRTTVTSLRRQLDASGWKLAVLARDRDQPNTAMEPLEQFVMLAKQIPSECRTVWDWVRVLAPSTSIMFLKGTQEPLKASLALPEDDKRLSTASSSSTLTSGESCSSASQSSASPRPPPTSILATNKLGNTRGRVKFVDEIAASPIRSSLSPSETESERETPIYSELSKVRGSDAHANVVEEEDLESDRESLYKDYAILDDIIPERRQQREKAQAATSKVTKEEKAKMKRHLSQVEKHVSALAQAIDVFFTTVETQKPPVEFVDRGKLMIRSAYQLVCLGDSLADELHSEAPKSAIKEAATRLYDALEECVAFIKAAADEYPNIECMQTMIDSVMTVARCSQAIKRAIAEWL
ncbi:unnamed protein product, partial [Mesorhabditis spiculigera]